MLIIIRDGLYLEYGYFETKHEFSHYEIIRGYNIFGEVLERQNKVNSQYRVLRVGDGIKTFKNETDLKSFLSKIGPHKIFCSDLIHRKFFVDRDTLM